MKITKEYLRTVIKEELQRLDEAFYQGGGEAGEAAFDDLQASTKSQYGNAPKGDRSATAAAQYKASRGQQRSNALAPFEQKMLQYLKQGGKNTAYSYAKEINRDEQGNAVVNGSQKIANMLLSGQFGDEVKKVAEKFLNNQMNYRTGKLEPQQGRYAAAQTRRKAAKEFEKNTGFKFHDGDAKPAVMPKEE